MNDPELLRRYAEENSEPAFTELVHRHVDLVYHAALRRANGDRQLAEEAAQEVFTRLARDARKLSRHAVLSGWLHTATRNATLNLMISQQRRKVRERVAVDIAAEPASPEWEQLRPVLDSAIDELPEPDRAAVILRYLERRAFAEIGAALRVSEDAARMRTDRALEKLRAALESRGITSTAAALGAVVSAHTLASAPGGLAATLAQGALATAAASLGAGFFGSLLTAKTAGVALVSAVAAFIGGGYVGVSYASQALLPPPELPEHTRVIAELRRDVAQLRANRDALVADNAKLSNELRVARSTPAPTATPPPEPVNRAEQAVVQRAIMNNLRQLHAARHQFLLEHRRPANSLDELVGDTKYIRRLNVVDGEDYSFVPLHPDVPITVTNRAGMAVTYDPAGTQTTALPAPTPTAASRAREQMRRLEPVVQQALQAYATAHGGERPSTPQALLPYFATTQQAADFVEALEAQKSAAAPGTPVPTGIQSRKP